MFIALKNFGSKDKQFYTGQEVPAKYVTERIIEIGCVGQVKDTLKKAESIKKTEILTEDSSDVKVEVQEQPVKKVEKVFKKK